jgi:hypothetical protein
MKDGSLLKMNLTQIVKQRDEKNIQTWLNFINVWGTKENVYDLAIQLSATA